MGFFEYWFQYVGIVRYDSDGIYFMCNQVFNNFYLLWCIGVGWFYLGGVEVKFFFGLDYFFIYLVKLWYVVYF